MDFGFAGSPAPRNDELEFRVGIIISLCGARSTEAASAPNRIAPLLRVRMRPRWVHRLRLFVGAPRPRPGADRSNQRLRCGKSAMFCPCRS